MVYRKMQFNLTLNMEVKQLRHLLCKPQNFHRVPKWWLGFIARFYGCRRMYVLWYNTVWCRINVLYIDKNNLIFREVLWNNRFKIFHVLGLKYQPLFVLRTDEANQQRANLYTTQGSIQLLNWELFEIIWDLRQPTATVTIWSGSNVFN